MAQLRAVTFNIHCGINQEEDAYSLERIGRSAMAADPHLLCIQEVERSDAEGQRTRKWSWSHSDDQVARLAEITGLPAASALQVVPTPAPQRDASLSPSPPPQADPYCHDGGLHCHVAGEKLDLTEDELTRWNEVTMSRRFENSYKPRMLTRREAW